MSWNCKSSRKEVSGIKVELWSSFIKRETGLYGSPRSTHTLKNLYETQAENRGKGQKEVFHHLFFSLFRRCLEVEAEFTATQHSSAEQLLSIYLNSRPEVSNIYSKKPDIESLVDWEGLHISAFRNFSKLLVLQDCMQFLWFFRSHKLYGSWSVTNHHRPERKKTKKERNLAMLRSILYLKFKQQIVSM